MLMSAKEFREIYFTPNSRPSIETIKNWINNGSLSGKKYGRLYFVVTDDSKETERITKPDFSKMEAK